MNASELQGPCSILALHGFWGSPSDFDPLRKSLGEKIPLEWEIPALPGHGGKPLPEDGASLESLAGWCGERIAARHNSDPCILLGYSLGARIALATAILHPEKIRALVLLSGSPGLEDPGRRQQRAALDAQRARELAACDTRTKLHEFLLHWWQQPVFQSAAWQTQPFLRHVEARIGETPAKLAAILEQASPGRQEPLWHRLQELRCPVLCIAGGADEKFTALAMEMGRQIPRSHTVILPAAGHSLLMENPPDLADAIFRFLSDPEAGE